jgi:hypothetical protein
MRPVCRPESPKASAVPCTVTDLAFALPRTSNLIDCFLPIVMLSLSMRSFCLFWWVGDIITD